MRPKNFATVVLLLFVAASMVVLAIKSLRSGPQAAEAENRAAEGKAPAGDAEPVPRSDGLIAYYFHGQVRCPTCESIEAYAREAVEGGFAEQLRSGRLRWRVVNYQQPGNEHFAQDYQLVAPSVVLVDIRGGVQKDWKDLPEVWQLASDKPAFIQFIQKEIREFLNGSGSP
jgi:hypothetical protein